MREVISFVLERELRILQSLFKERESWLVRELADAVKATEKTIRTDIKRINETFPFLHIEITSRGQVKLDCPSYVGIEYVYRKVMDLSLECKVFEYLLSKSNQSINVCIEELFISESMFRRIVHKWNQAFANRELPVSISTFPLVTIEGDETIVRQLFHRYMVEKYEGDVQSEFLRKINSIWELITRIWNIFGMKISYATHLKLSYWVFVSMKRIRQGYFIKKDYSEHGKKIAQTIYIEVSKDTVFIEQFVFDNHVALSVEMLLDMVEFYDFDLLLMENLTKEISVYEQKETGLSVKALQDFLFSLYESVDYQSSSLEQTSVALYNSLVFQNKIPFFFYDPYSDFKEYVKRENSLFVGVFEKHLAESNLPDYLKQKDELKNELLYYVIIHSKSLLESAESLITPKKVLILTTYYYKYMYWLRDRIENAFTNSVAVTLYQSMQLKFDVDYLSQFDIILANYENLPSELENRIIYLDVGVSTEFWVELAKKIKS